MKWTTLLLLSASGMAASTALVWTATTPAAGSTPPRSSASAGATTTAGRTAPAGRPADGGSDRSQFQAGATLVMEGRLGHRVLPAATDSQSYLLVEVSAAPGQRALTSAPLNLGIVLDRSGSMKGKRLANAVAAARSAVERLRDGDLVSAVAYNTTADVILSPTVVDARSRPGLLRALERLRAGGDTCISCGVDAAMRLIGQRAGMVSRMLLLSDGEATAGLRNSDDFQRMAEDCRRMGASITTIGVDVDYNERIMAALARGSNGRHFFVDNPTGLPAIFDEEMESLTGTVANGAELTVDLAPGVFAEHVYDRASLSGGSQVVVPLGPFTAGERKTLLVRVLVPRGQAGDRLIAAVRLRYDDLTRGPGQTGRSEGALAIRLSNDTSEVSPLDGLVSARLSSSDIAEALEQANRLFRAGRADEARRLVDDKTDGLRRRRRAARVSTPAVRARDLEASFDRQEKALEGSTAGFSEPPPPAEPSAAAGSGDRAGPVQIRSNQKRAVDLRE